MTKRPPPPIPDDFRRILEYLVSAYPDTKLGLRTLEVFWDQLRTFEYRQLVTAARQHVASSKRFPTIAEIRALIPPPSCQGPVMLPPAKRLGPAEALEAVHQVMERLTGKKS